MNKIKIRKVKPKDVKIIKDIIVKAWGDKTGDCIMENLFLDFIDGIPWQRKIVKDVKSFSKGFKNIFVTELNGKVVGFASYSFMKKTKIGVVGYNAVYPDACGNGIGTMQIKNILKTFIKNGMKYAQVNVNIDKKHLPAKKMYEKVGFKPFSSQMKYFMKIDDLKDSSENL